MSETPFTNIKTCNSELDAQAEDNRRRAYDYANGVIVAILRTAS